MAQMKMVWWSAALSVLSAVAVSAVVGAGAEVWLGLAAPLVVVSASWVLAARTYHTQPERLTSVMATGFAGKLMLFGAYFWIALRVLHVRPVPFIVSFTAYFIALYAAEAVSLQRLFAERMRAA